MTEPELERDVLSRVRMDRRGFVKRLVMGGAFAVPVVASFDMDSLVDVAAARSPNGTRRQHVQHFFPYRHHGDDSHQNY